MNSTHYDNSKLIAARELLGQTQQQIAEAMGVNRQTIYRVEQGSSVSFELLAKLCAHYRIPLNTIVHPAPVKQAA